jgi:hypothetical protein
MTNPSAPIWWKASHTPLFDKLSSIKPHELEHFAAASMDKPDRAICGASPVKQASAETKPKASKAKKAEPAG